MVENALLSLAKEALLLIVILSSPPVLVSLFVGLFISIIQATTQIQDQTLTFVPKLVGVMLTLVLFGTWGAKNMINFAAQVLGNFPTMIK